MLNPISKREKSLPLDLVTNKIVEELFLPSYGGTTKANFVKALGIEEDDNEWIIKKENREW